MGARQDAWGLPVTGDADAVALWDAALDDYLAFDGPDRTVEDWWSRRLDLAVGHALLALAPWTARPTPTRSSRSRRPSGSWPTPASGNGRSWPW